MEIYSKKQFIHIPIELKNVPEVEGAVVHVEMINPKGMKTVLIADKQAEAFGDNFLYDFTYVPSDLGVYKYLIRVYTDENYTVNNDKATLYLIHPNRFNEFYVQLPLLSQPLPTYVIPGSIADYLKQIAGNVHNNGGTFTNGDCKTFIGIPVPKNNTTSYLVRIYSMTTNQSNPSFLDSVVADEKVYDSKRGQLLGHSWYLGEGIYLWEVLNQRTGATQSDTIVVNCGSAKKC